MTAIGLTTDGTRLIVAGNFQTINGGFGQRHIGAVSPATGATLSWLSHPSYPVITLALDSHGVFVAGNGNGGNVASFNPTTGLQQWIGGVDGNVQAIAVDSAGEHRLRRRPLQQLLRPPDRHQRVLDADRP
ncbi:MAG TPA: hypothetical protein VHS27_11685 [Gaiellales bacterium]|nr:hypothetical protein [Gaiellales bacterium]